MRIAVLNRDNKERTMLSSFGGYDKREVFDSESFFEMRNMGSDKSPYASTRRKRGILNMGDTKVYDIRSADIYHRGALRKNALIADCENRIKAFYEEDGVFSAHDIINTSSTLTKGEKIWVAEGTEFYFFPDKIYYDIINGTSTSLDYHGELPLGARDGYFYEVSLEPCDIYGEDAESESPYRRLVRAAYTVDSSGNKKDFKEYISFSTSVKEGDSVKVSGFDEPTLNGYYNVKHIPIDRKALVVEGIREYTQSSGTIYINRDVPEMDHVVSCQNRLWGCRYGMNSEGDFVNEIYASALGDGKNWNRFLGVSTDSYVVSVGCAGAFTGACVIDGNPVFFKEDAIIKVYGSYPSEYCVVESPRRGIENGSHKSCVFVNDELYYKSYSGIVRYDGGVPVNVDAPLGNEKFKNAVAGAVDNKYYVSMEGEDGVRRLFVYDTVKRVWHKEDEADVLSFCRCGRDLYFLCAPDKEGNTCIYSTDILPKTQAEEDFSWMCETARWGYGIPDRKYVTSLEIRLRGGVTTKAEVFIEYDGDGIWSRAGCLEGNGQTVLRIRPRRCDSLRLRLCGTGECELHSITKTVERCSPYSRKE